MKKQSELFKEQRRKHYSILVKPTAMCNLNCEYCYDLPMRERLGNCKMSREIVEHIADLVNEYAEEVTWIWHGGEATMMGREWFEGIQEVFHKRYATEFTQNMQSNGLNFARDYGWIDTLNITGINPGISYDGFTQEVRVGSTQDDMTNLIKSYKERGTSLGSITVVNKQNIDKLIELYEYNKKEFGRDFSNCLNVIFKTFTEKCSGLELDYTEYVPKISEFYQHMLYDTTREAYSERSLNSTLSQVLGTMNKVCCTYTDCRLNWIGVNADGTIYPCDRFLKNYEIGNIMDFNSIEEIYTSDNFIRYYNDIQKRFDNHCSKCAYFDYCKGGCNANHESVDGSLDNVNENECNILKYRFNAVYFLLQGMKSTDVINYKYAQYLIESKILLISDIECLLNSIGYEVTLNLNEDDFASNPDKLLNTPQFKLFRLFNQYRDTDASGHEDYSEHAYRVSVTVGPGKAVLDETFESRLDYAMHLYEDNAIEVENLVREVMNYGN